MAEAGGPGAPAPDPIDAVATVAGRNTKDHLNCCNSMEDALQQMHGHRSTPAMVSQTEFGKPALPPGINWELRDKQFGGNANLSHQPPHAN